MATRIDTIVIGAGQAGLATSWHLTQRGIEHVVLEKDRIGESWRSKRWDSFTLVTPGSTLKLPGFPYQGDPDKFLHRDEVIAYLEEYAASFEAPIRSGVRVESVRPRSDGAIEVATEHDAQRESYVADHVVVAIGAFQRPKIPGMASALDPGIVQVHASAYRRPDALPQGGVLVVGGGQSGAQIADELNDAGREVFLSVGRSSRAPRRYRGRDLFFWAQLLGMVDRTVDQLEDPAERFVANPIASGKNGGKRLGLHQLARDGVTLLGRLEAVDGTTVRFADTLRQTLQRADETVEQIKQGIDAVVAEKGLDVPDPHPGEDPIFTDGYDAPIIPELDLTEASVHSVVWATGFSFDFSWIEGPEYDAFGYPVTRRGVTAQPGVYFVGLHWLHTLKSGLFFGVGADAEHVVAHLDDARTTAS